MSRFTAEADRRKRMNQVVEALLRLEKEDYAELYGLLDGNHPVEVEELREAMFRAVCFEVPERVGFETK